MSDQKIKMKLPNAREKLQPLFPQDNRGDIKIIFGKKIFKLQRAFLRLQSGYFKKTFSQNTDVLQIKQDFNENHFSNVLKCFYGFTVEISRSEMLDYYPIIKFLEVESLLKVLRDDMISKSEHYDIFVLIQLAHKYDEQEVFQICLSQLEKQNFEQLRYGKHQLLKCPMQLFKMIIKTHNRMKSEKGKGIQFIQIDQLIKDFSQEKKLNQNQYQQLKFDLIDKKSLTATQYKQIFLDDVKRKKNQMQYKSMVKLQQETGLFNSSFGSSNILAASKLTQSVIEPIKKMNDDLTLEMENTFQKKKNQQLQAQNNYLVTELKSLKQSTTLNKKNFDDLKQIVDKLQKKLQEKQLIDREQSNIIKRLEKMCIDLKKEVTERGQTIKKLEDKVNKLEKQPQKRISGNPKYIPYDQQQDESKTIQSQIVPGHLLKEIAKPAAEALIPPSGGGFKKSKQVSTPAVVAEAKVQQELDQDEIQQLYMSRLEFDCEPRCCPKKYLPKLANFVTSDGFQKKRLNLIFRRNNANQQIVGNSSDLRNKNSLLVIICTKLNQIIGGFTSIQISKGCCDYISDENAFIFSLTKNQKFNIKKASISQALFFSSDYLIAFSNDLMIPSDCIKQQCECSWPFSYESGSEKRGSRWLTGEDQSFSIKQIQIYQVKEEQMIMDL